MNGEEKKPPSLSTERFFPSHGSTSPEWSPRQARAGTDYGPTEYHERGKKVGRKKYFPLKKLGEVAARPRSHRGDPPERARSRGTLAAGLQFPDCEPGTPGGMAPPIRGAAKADPTTPGMPLQRHRSAGSRGAHGGGAGEQKRAGAAQGATERPQAGTPAPPEAPPARNNHPRRDHRPPRRARRGGARRRGAQRHGGRRKAQGGGRRANETHPPGNQKSGAHGRPKAHGGGATKAVGRATRHERAPGGRRAGGAGAPARASARISRRKPREGATARQTGAGDPGCAPKPYT